MRLPVSVSAGPQDHKTACSQWGSSFSAMTPQKAISIVELFTKEARNEVVELAKKDAPQCQGQIAVCRAQVPKY